MGARILEELKEKVNNLTLEENLELIDHLVHRIRMAQASSARKRKWNEIYGASPYPLTGEDAQTWVTRMRHESDTDREARWK